MNIIRKTLLSSAIGLTLITGTATAGSLTDIYQQALQQDPQLKAAEAASLAGAEAGVQGRAGLLPSINLSGNTTWIDSDSAQYNNHGYTVSLSQPLFSAAAWFNFKQGQAQSEAATLQFDQAQQGLILRVVESYLNVLRAHSTLETSLAEERAIQRRLDQVNAQFEVGLIAITDVHEAQAAFDDAAVNRLEARSDVNIAFEGLQVLTGQDHQVLAGLKDNFTASAPVPETNEDWVDLALANNFQLKVAELGKDAAYNQAKAAAAVRLPKISGRASYYDSDAEGTNLGNPFESLQDGHQYVVSISMPIWGGGVDAQRRQAKQRSIQSAESYTAAKRNTVQSARSKHQSVITNAARVKARRQAITSADSALSATQAGYEVGTRNIVDVLVAQRTLYRAKRNYANARYDYILSMMALKEVAGQLSPEDIASLNAWLDPKLVIAK